MQSENASTSLLETSWDSCVISSSVSTAKWSWTASMSFSRLFSSASVLTRSTRSVKPSTSIKATKLDGSGGRGAVAPACDIFLGIRDPSAVSFDCLFNELPNFLQEFGGDPIDQHARDRGRGIIDIHHLT